MLNNLRSTIYNVQTAVRIEVKISASVNFFNWFFHLGDTLACQHGLINDTLTSNQQQVTGNGFFIC